MSAPQLRTEQRTNQRTGIPTTKVGLGRLRVPFLETRPLEDIWWLLIATPLLWVLGLEQFFAVPVLLWSAVKLLGRGVRLPQHPVLLALLFLLIAMTVSALFVDEAFRYITYVRNVSMYVNAALIVLIVLASAPTLAEIRRLLRALVVLMGLAALIGLLGIIDISRPQFSSLFGQLLPASISDTGYGQQIANRSTGNMAWFRLFGGYFRVSSFFMFSTMYAAALAISIPIAAYFCRVGTWRSRSLSAVILGLLIVNLVFTTGRMAMVGLVAGLLVLILQNPNTFWKVVTTTLITAGIAASLLWIPEGSVTGVVDEFVFARGEGSPLTRLTIYQSTLEGLIQRPMFGWGTERDIVGVEGMTLPAGSHSYYLGMAYKHGLFGLAVFAALLVAIARGIQVPRRSGVRDQAPEAVLASHVQWALVAAAVIGVTSALDLDATLVVVLTVIVACGLANRTVYKRRLVRQSGVAAAGSMNS